MKTIITFAIVFLLSYSNTPNVQSTQTGLSLEEENFVFNDEVTVEDIQEIKKVPYIHNCTDPIFWSLVYQKDNIPALIKKLTDETVLKGIYVPNFGGEYTVADVALSILNEKIKGVPVFELIGRPISEECGYCSYWNYVRESKENRFQLQQNFTTWYFLNESKFVWVESPMSLTGDCSSPINEHGYYEVNP